MIKKFNVKIILLIILVLLSISLNVYAEEMNYAEMMFEILTRDTKEHLNEELSKGNINTQEYNEKYKQGLKSMQASYAGEKAAWNAGRDDVGFVKTVPTKEQRKKLYDLLEAEYNRFDGGTVSKPEGLTEEEQREIEKNVNEYLITIKGNPNYKALLQQKINSNVSGYSKEGAAYRKKLYENELKRFEASENVNIGDIQKETENMTEQEIRDKISQLERDLARYEAMASSYQEGGKTRDQLIAEIKAKISAYRDELAKEVEENDPTKFQDPYGDGEYKYNDKYGITEGLLGTPNAETKHTLGEIIAEAMGFIDKNTGKATISQDNLQKVSSTLYNILLGIGIALALIIGMYLGIKFMMSSAEDKAKVKEALIPYIAGCVVVFGAFIIWKLALTLLSGLK